MGLILWIDQNTFATSLIERAFKIDQLPFYTLSSVEDFSYLVDDLNPILIVLDGETYSKNSARFLLQYKSSIKMQNTPFVLLEPKDDFSFLKIHLGNLKRPLDPFEIPNILKNILSSH